MLEINQGLLEKLQDVNRHLEETYSFLRKENEIIRQKLTTIQTDYRQVRQMSAAALKDWLKGKDLAAVDGSVNQTKGEYPHVLYFFQALAKTTTGYQCTASEIYTPLMEKETKDDQSISQLRSHKLAKHELEVAYQLIEEKDLRLVLMDGAYTIIELTHLMSGSGYDKRLWSGMFY